jgi:hypothetical protein
MPPALRVGAGLAVTRAGRALDLPEALTVWLARAEDVPTGGSARFAACMPPRPRAGTKGVPLLLLSVAPAPEVAEGRARIEGLGNEAAACAVDVLAEALRFRLTAFTIPAVPLNLRLRSRAANLLLGSSGADATRLAEDPLGKGAQQTGLLEALVGPCLTSEDVPLALLSWPEGSPGPVFCDRWAVRRRLVAPAAAGPWAGLAGAQRAAIAEARLLQFQEQLADLLSLPFAGTRAALDTFTHLPPAGIVPLQTDDVRGFDADRFLAGLTVHREAFLEGARLGAVLAAAAQHPPIDLERTPREAIWRYVVRNDATPKVTRPNLRPAYLLFVTGHVPYVGSAQYDLAHCDQANYAL